jgi:hypothetical protein
MAKAPSYNVEANGHEDKDVRGNIEMKNGEKVC